MKTLIAIAMLALSLVSAHAEQGDIPAPLRGPWCVVPDQNPHNPRQVYKRDPKCPSDGIFTVEANNIQWMESHCDLIEGIVDEHSAHELYHQGLYACRGEGEGWAARLQYHIEGSDLIEDMGKVLHGPVVEPINPGEQ